MQSTEQRNSSKDLIKPSRNISRSNKKWRFAVYKSLCKLNKSLRLKEDRIPRVWLHGKETFLSLECNCIQLYIEMWLPFTDLSQCHSKLCGPLFPPPSTSDTVHQYHNNTAGSEMLWEVWNELTPNKKPKEITPVVKEWFILQDLATSLLCLLQLYTSSHVGPPTLRGTANFGSFFNGQKYPARLSHFTASLTSTLQTHIPLLLWTLQH